MSSDLTERIGVEQVRARFVGELGWYPREPERPDYGIDVYVECADDGRPNGRLLGVQVKSGSSYFDEATDEGLKWSAAKPARRVRKLEPALRARGRRCRDANSLGALAQ